MVSAVSVHNRMRLLFWAVGIVLGLGFGVWGIRLLPEGTPVWIGVTLIMVWLVLLLLLATLASGSMLWLTIYRAKKKIKKLVREVCAHSNLFSFGATEIDPKYFGIWITTKTDSERDNLRTKPELIDKFRTALLEAGYPREAVPEVGFQFESQETVNRDFGGSWYLATK